MDHVESNALNTFLWESISFHRVGQLCTLLVFCCFLPILFVLWKRGKLTYVELDRVTSGLVMPKQPNGTIHADLSKNHAVPERSMWIMALKTNQQLEWSESTHTLSILQNPGIIQISCNAEMQQISCMSVWSFKNWTRMVQSMSFGNIGNLVVPQNLQILYIDVVQNLTVCERIAVSFDQIKTIDDSETQLILETKHLTPRLVAKLKKLPLHVLFIFCIQ